MVNNPDQLLAEKVVREIGELRFRVLELESFLQVANERIKELTPVQNSEQPVVD